MLWDVIIAGAGIIGVSLAVELRERGAKVLVFDSGEPGRESSSAAAGMLAPSDPETPGPLRLLAAESARLFPAFIRKLESLSEMPVDFRRHGSIAFVEESDVPDTYRKLSSSELQQLEPALRTQSYPAFFVQEDSVDPELLMQAALAAAQHCGVAIRSNTAVEQMLSGGGQVDVVAGGEHFTARAAVNCCGAWSGAPVKPRKGQMLYLQPQRPALLTHVVRSPEVYLLPRSSGRVLVGATVEDVGYDKTVNPEAIENLHRNAANYVPDLGTAKVVASWAGLRPGTPDDLPILGPTESPGIFIASGHFRNGILLAPVTAQVMADLIMGKEPHIEIVQFSVARF